MFAVSTCAQSPHSMSWCFGQVQTDSATSLLSFLLFAGIFVYCVFVGVVTVVVAITQQIATGRRKFAVAQIMQQVTRDKSETGI